MRYHLRLIPLLGLACLLTSCASRYNITTNNGHTVTSKGKPKYDKANSVFHYKDANGVERTVPAGSVRSIAPAS